MKKIFLILLAAVCLFSCKEKIKMDETAYVLINEEDTFNQPYGNFIQLYANPMWSHLDKNAVPAEGGYGFVVGKDRDVEISTAMVNNLAYYDAGTNEFYATVMYEELGNDYSAAFYARGYVMQNSQARYSKPYSFHLLKPITDLQIQEKGSTIRVKVGGSVQLHAIFTPSDVQYAAVKWSSSDSSVATVDNDGTVHGVSRGKATITATESIYVSHSDYCEVVVIGEAVEGAVDLGFGPYWGEKNLGASSPQDVGGWVAWADTYISTDGKNKNGYNCFTWSRYKYRGPQNDWGNCIKYNQSDGNRRLAPEDDAATANLGAGWRMPTKSEFEDLIKYCNITPETNGVTLTSTITGKSIFLPYTGYWHENTSEQYNKLNPDCGHYWSSEVRWLEGNYSFNGTSHAHHLLIKQNGTGLSMDVKYRDDGLAVRPVYE